MKRGNVIICTISGDYGKPRPAIIVQTDLFNPTHTSITICPITTHLLDTPLFRLVLTPTQLNGLTSISQIMIDKITTIKSDKIAQKIGELTYDEIIKLDDALKLWIGLN